MQKVEGWGFFVLPEVPLMNSAPAVDLRAPPSAFTASSQKCSAEIWETEGAALHPLKRGLGCWHQLSPGKQIAAS